MGPIHAEVEIDAPRERVFALVGDLSLRPSFTDHFLTGFHLTRLESRGVGAGARFRVEDAAALALGGHGDRRAGGEHADRRAGRRRPLQPHPHPHGLGAERRHRRAGQAEADPLDRAGEPPGPRGRVAQLGRLLAAAGLARGAAPAARGDRGRAPGGRADRRRGGQPLRDRHPLIDSRPPMFSDRRFTLPLFAALALLVLGLGTAACGYKSESKEVAEGESVYLGELQFNVIFSRYLNPNDTEDAAYLVGQPPPPNGEFYFGVFLLVEERTQRTAAAAGNGDDHRRRPQGIRPRPKRKPLRLPVRHRSRRTGTDPDPRLDPPAGPDRGLAGALPAARSGLRRTGR